MNRVDIRVFLHQNRDVKEINSGNEWLDALLSGEAVKEKKPARKTKPVVSGAQQFAVGRG